MPLLTKAREISNEVFLKAAAASFREAWRMVDVLIEVGAGPADLGKKASAVSRTQAEDVMSVAIHLKCRALITELGRADSRCSSPIWTSIWTRRSSLLSRLSISSVRSGTERYEYLILESDSAVPTFPLVRRLHKPSQAVCNPQRRRVFSAHTTRHR